MRLEHLHYILITAKLGSISKASEKIPLHQQQLSKIINNMEKELNVPIFNRTMKGVTLTSEGKQLADTVSVMLREWNDCLVRIKNYRESPSSLNGTLFINAISSIWEKSFTNSLIGTFAEAHSSVAIILNESDSDHIIRHISNSPNHLGIIARVLRKNFETPLIPDNLVFFPLIRSEPVIYAAKNHHIVEAHQPISMKKLLEEPMIVYKSLPEVISTAEGILVSFGKPNIKYTVSNMQTFHKILSKGKVVTLGVYNKDLLTAHSHLEAVRLKECLKIETGLLAHKNNIQTNILNKAFIDFALNYQFSDP